jgi:hypothetical protein
MPSQQIASEIVLQVAPDSVDVVPAALCVVVLHQHGRALDAVVVRAAGLVRTSPGEVQAPEPGVFDALPLSGCRGVCHPSGVQFEQSTQLPLLGERHLGRRQARESHGFHRGIVAGENVPERLRGDRRAGALLRIEHL